MRTATPSTAESTSSRDQKGMQMARRRHAGLLVVVIAGALVAPAISAAETQCTIPATSASSDEPHSLDPTGDPTLLGVAPPLVHGDATDVGAVWISKAEDADEFRVSVQVAALDNHPGGVVYFIEFENRPWLSARALADGTWVFARGGVPASTPIGSVRQDSGALSGDVDVARDTISVTVPTDLLPARPADPTARVVVHSPIVRAGYAVRAPIDGGSTQPQTVLVAADTTANAESCDVLLYGEGS